MVTVDMCIQGSSVNVAFVHAPLVALVLMALGWSLNWEKSCFVTSQEFTHLGFIFNSQTMTIFVKLRLSALKLCADALQADF